MRMQPRSGFSLIELLAAFTLGALLVAFLSGLMLAQLRLARTAAQRVVDAETIRTTVAAISGELRRARPEDVRAIAGDSLALRAFRGTGIVCNAAGSSLYVRYRGDRAPDARKDSIVVISASGAHAHALVDVRAAPAGACADKGDEVLEWRLDTSVAAAAAGLVFESGAYFLSTRALRYRLGSEGRQPLTTESLLHPQTRFRGVAGDAIHFDLATHAAAVRTHAASFAPK